MTNPLQIMVDLETMGTGPSAAIVSIGAVAFNPFTTWASDDTFYREVDLESSVSNGGIMDVSTVKFWLGAAKDAPPTWASSELAIQTVLGAFSNWVKSSAIGYEGVRIWGHGATFDPVVLHSAYHNTGMVPPFSYRDPRDTRTLFELAKFDFRAFPVTGTLHNALDDALTQTKAVQECYRILGLLS